MNGKTLWAVGAALLLFGCGRSEVLDEVTAVAGSNTLDAEQIETDLLARWNAAATGVTATSNGVEWNFHWDRIDRFPHPTFRGGSSAAYQAFAEVLIHFLEVKDNVAFLERHQLAQRTFMTAAGKPVTFCGLLVQLSTSPLVDQERQALLAALGQGLRVCSTVTSARSSGQPIRAA